jgi:hypothetical protein
MLRALALRRDLESHWEALLDVSDMRTLRKLTERAGLNDGRSLPSSASAFLAQQRFVRQDNEGLRVLKSLINEQDD